MQVNVSTNTKINIHGFSLTQEAVEWFASMKQDEDEGNSYIDRVEELKNAIVKLVEIREHVEPQDKQTIDKLCQLLVHCKKDYDYINMR